MRVQTILLIGATLLGYCFGEQNSPSQKQYYDEREKVAEKLTFEWAGVAHVRYTREFYQATNEVRRQRASKFPGVLEILPLFDVEKASTFVFERNDTLIVERTPEMTRVSLVTPVIDINLFEVSDSRHYEEVYLVGRTAIGLERDDDGKVTMVQVAEGGEDDAALKMGPAEGYISPVHLVFFGGASPMRLFGGKLEEWKLVSCTPEEWVFERSVSHRKLADKVRIHLNRKYQDAISRIEVQMYGGEDTEEWRVLEYQSIQGAWFPKEVEVVHKGLLNERKTRWVLVGYRRTDRLTFPKIPEEVLVYDWRPLGYGAWATDHGYQQVEWGEVKSSLPELPEEEP